MKTEYFRPLCYPAVFLLSAILLNCDKDKSIDPNLPSGVHLMASLNIQYTNSVSVYGDYAYVVGEPGLLVIDISDPSNPDIVGSCDTVGTDGTIFVDGSYAYMSAGAIVNIENPAEPFLIGRFPDLLVPTGLFIDGDYAYFSSSTMALTIFDIADRADPVLVKEYNPTGSTSGIWIEGNYAFLAYGDHIRIIGIIDVLRPVHIKSAFVPGPAVEVCVRNDIAYVTGDTSGLFLIDIDPLNNATWVGTYDTPGAAFWVCSDGNYAYVADRESGLQIIDCHDPANPVFAASYETSGPANCVFVYRGYIYLTDMEKLYILKFVP
ncbi:MAG: hypothetical protein JSU85_09560 [Candidatus Zixiibacteriota bacterium]|nr:MAG: hypothetical protein JSU85_09560 [candidate division Zixibacteria bacterium]